MEIVVKIIVLFFLLGSITQRIEAQGKFTISSAVITPEGDTVNRINHNGEKEGKWLVYKEGRKIEELYYNNGIKNGKSFLFANDGSIIEERNYCKGELTGKLIEYAKDTGNKFIETEYENGRKNGKSIIYHENGKIFQEEYYVNDILDGKVTTYFKNGRVSVKAEMKQGKRSGTWYVYSLIFGKIKESDFNTEGNLIEKRKYFWGIRIKTNKIS